MGNLAVYSPDPRHQASSLLTNSLFSSVLCAVGLVIVVLAFLAVSLLFLAAGGGLVGCGIAGVYRSQRHRRNGR